MKELEQINYLNKIESIKAIKKLKEKEKKRLEEARHEVNLLIQHINELDIMLAEIENEK